MQTNNSNHESSFSYTPTVTDCYKQGWTQFGKYFLELLVVNIIVIVISVPAGITAGISENIGILALFFIPFSIAYAILIEKPAEYGVAYVSLKAARNQKPDIKDLFYVLENYLNVVLAGFLVNFIIGIGVVFCVVPGIFLACKLAFVPFLVVDKKYDAITAIKESWRLTTGHATTVFVIGVLGVLLCIAGVILCFVGIIGALIWIRLAFANLYYEISSLEEKQASNISTVPNIE